MGYKNWGKIVICFVVLFIMLVGNSNAAPKVKVVNTPDVNVVNTPDVDVVNTAANPVQVRDVDNPARQPWQMQGQVIFESSLQVVTTFNPLIPEGKVFVIEFMTAHAYLTTGQMVRFILFTDVGVNMVQHFFAPTFVGTDSGNDHFVMSQPTRLYAINELRINATRFPDSVGSGGHVNFSLSGYLVEQ